MGEEKKVGCLEVIELARQQMKLVDPSEICHVSCTFDDSEFTGHADSPCWLVSINLFSDRGILPPGPMLTYDLNGRLLEVKW